jgi:hypothetical protein
MGGKALKPEQRSFSRNRDLAKAAGRKGGLTPKRAKSKLTSAEINSIADEVLAKVPRGASDG